MIYWITGNSGAGKTSLARKMRKDEIILDGDDMRTIWQLGFSKEDRIENNRRIYKLAKILENQGVDVIVASICPYKETRQEFKKVKFIYLDGGQEPSDKYPYEL